MVTIKDEGDKITLGASLHVFVKGAYNQGPVYEAREATSANLHPGLGAIHATGAAGEDDYTEHGNDSALSYAIIELDENQIADCTATYAAYDNVPGLPYHLNPGAYVRNIKIANPSAAIPPDTPFTAEATGQFGLAIEATLVSSSTNTTESFTATATSGLNGTNGATIHSRIYIRNAYYRANPAAATTIVAYIAKGE